MSHRSSPSEPAGSMTRREAMKLAAPAVVAGLVAARTAGDSVRPKDPTSPLFTQDRLHETQIVMSAEDWKALRRGVFKNDYYTADLRIDGEGVSKVGVRSRGDGSRFSEKPSFKVDVNRYVKGQKFRGLKSLVLKNLGEDETGLRERLAFSVFEAVGIAAPRNSFTSVTVNGEYRGVYSLVEPIRKPFLRSRLRQSGGNLFDYEYETDPEILYDFSYRGPDPKAYVPRPFKPRTHKAAPDGRALVAFLRVLNQASDAGVSALVSRYLDLRQFVTYIAVENALADSDGFGADSGRNNFFFYQPTADSRFIFIPWDKDMSLQQATWPVFLNSERNVLTRRILKDPTWRTFYQERVAQVVESFVNPRWLMPRIESGYGQIGESFRADRYMPFPARMYDRRVNDLRRIVEGRPKGILPGANWG